MADTVKNQAEQATPTFTDADVLAWLSENPRFLLTHAETLRTLAGDANAGENITHLHAFQAKRWEKETNQLSIQHERLVHTVAANSASAGALFSLIPSLIACPTIAKLRTFCQTTLRQELAIKSVRLIMADAAIAEPTATTWPTTAIEDLFPENRRTTLRTLSDHSERAIYGATGKMMRSDALIKLVDPEGTTLGLMALGSEDETRFHAGQGDDLIRFFGQVASVRLTQLVNASVS